MICICNVFVSGQRQAAIVTPIAGTTRDVVELSVNIGGYPVVLADTAGLRYDTEDLVEKEGISRAHAWTEKADLIIIVIDIIKYLQKCKSKSLSFGSFLCNYIQELKLQSIILEYEANSVSPKEDKEDHFLNEICSSSNCMVVLNKTDMVEDSEQFENICEECEGMVTLSCKTEDGVPELLDKMTRKLTVL